MTDHTKDVPPHQHGGTDAPECTTCRPAPGGLRPFSDAEEAAESALTWDPPPAPGDAPEPTCGDTTPHRPHHITRALSDTGSQMVTWTCPGSPPTLGDGDTDLRAAADLIRWAARWHNTYDTHLSDFPVAFLDDLAKRIEDGEIAPPALAARPDADRDALARLEARAFYTQAGRLVVLLDDARAALSCDTAEGNE